MIHRASIIIMWFGGEEEMVFSISTDSPIYINFILIRVGCQIFICSEFNLIKYSLYYDDIFCFKLSDLDNLHSRLPIPQFREVIPPQCELQEQRFVRLFFNELPKRLMFVNLTESPNRHFQFFYPIYTTCTICRKSVSGHARQSV